jgi:hypothetical protein
MKKVICLAGCLLLSGYLLYAQDEAVIRKKERIERSNSVFIDFGPSFTLGKNIGDYSVGFNVEAGFVKRLNRILSVGPSVSYLSFNYDQEKTGLNNAFIGGPYTDNQGNTLYEGLYFELEGGELSLISLAANLKLNFIPVKDNSKISVYAFAKPFVTYATRGEVTGKGTYLTNYGDIEDAADWEIERTFDWKAGADPFGIFKGSEDLKKQSQVTGGIFVGPGLEFLPAGKISAFFQASIGYTFPVSYISTKVYENSIKTGNDLDVFLKDINEYPLTKKGFPSVNLQFGAAYNF